MNKKLKKALYMFGFALPIVAIPIITVACGTQTTQVEPTPTPAPEQQPNKEPEIKEPEIKKIEEVKPNLNVLKNKEISEEILSDDIKSLLDNWKDSKFEINSKIKGNNLYFKLIASHIDDSTTTTNNQVKLKSELKYSDLIKNISELNFVDLFNISSLSIENLKDDKLKTLKLSEVFSDDMTKLVEAIKQKNEEEFAKEGTKYDDSSNNNKGIKQKINELIDKNPSSSFIKIKSDLGNKDIDSDKFKNILKKLKFSDLIDIQKLETQLTYIKDN